MLFWREKGFSSFYESLSPDLKKKLGQEWMSAGETKQRDHDVSINKILRKNKQIFSSLKILP